MLKERKTKDGLQVKLKDGDWVLLREYVDKFGVGQYLADLLSGVFETETVACERSESQKTS